MQQQNSLILLISILLLLSMSFTFANEIITTGHLLQELVDLPNLTVFPKIPYKVVQYSSYDRRSILRLHKDWFANSDGFGREPIPGFESVIKPETNNEDGEYLICNVEAPGAIVRTWTAGMKGKLKVYLDGNDTPIYEGEAEAFLRYPYSTFLDGTGIDEKILHGTLYQRDSAYCPIPFSRQCKIVWVGKIKDLHFYHIMCRIYPKDTPIQTFSPDDLKTYRETVERVVEFLQKPEQIDTIESLSRSPFNAEIPPNQEMTIWSDKNGPQYVALLRIKINEHTELTLRELHLRIYADGIQEPLVESPLADFFASAPGINPFTSLPLAVTPEGELISRFPMPYRNEIKISLKNLFSKPVTISGEIGVSPYRWDEEHSMYFIARWRASESLWIRVSHPYDLPFLTAKGKGCLVGAVSHLFNPSPIPTSGGNWWGEGDEKIFVDEDKIPSIFGTGSEDFYNYSWSAPDIFYHPFCGQPRNDGPGNRGFVSNYRYLFLDRIPFQQWISFNMELLIHDEVFNMAYARIAYYYARPETTDDHSPIPDKIFQPLDAQPQWNWLPKPKGAAHNSLFYQAEDCLITSTDNVKIQQSYLWAGRGLCWWTPNQPQEKLQFVIHVPEEKEYQIRAIMAYTPQSGKCSVLIDDKPVSNTDEPLNLYENYRTLSREVTLCKQTLTKGKHTITIQHEGPDQSSIGIDFFWLQ